MNKTSNKEFKYTLFTDVLERLMKFYNVSRLKDLSVKIDITYSTISTWQRRNKIPYELLMNIAHKENISLDWLLLGKEDKDSYSGEKKTSDVYIDHYLDSDAESIAYVDEEENIKEKHYFPLSSNIIGKYLRATKQSTDNMKIITVIGNSMEPTINHNDKVFIQTVDSNEAVMKFNGVIYAINYKKRIYIKRLQINPVTDAINMISDNPQFQAIEIPGDDTHELKIIGRVVLKCSFAEIS